MSIETHIQKENVGPYIELFKLDTSVNGGSVYFFTPNNDNGTPITWDGDVYNDVACRIDGISYSYAEPSTPTLNITMINKFMYSAIITGDVVGATLTRNRTFQELLATPAERLPPDIFLIKAIASLNKRECVLALGSIIDKNTVKLPRKLVLQDEFPGIRSVATL